MPDEGRIVSLLPAATELLAALGVWEQVVAVSHECDVPAEATRLPRVTVSRIDGTAAPAAIDGAVREAGAAGLALFQLDDARIAHLAPTLIVTQGLCEVCAVDAGAVHALAARLHPAARVLSLGARTLDEVLASIGELARAVGRPDEGDELRAGLQARLRQVHRTLAGARAPRPRVAVLEWTDPLFAAGHWVPDMVRRAGGIDVLARAGDHSRQVSVAQVREAAPDVLLVAPCGLSLDRAIAEAEDTLAHPDWSWVDRCTVVAIDGNAYTARPGPRLVDGVEIMARLFHPALFSPLLPGRGARVTLRPRCAS